MSNNPLDIGLHIEGSIEIQQPAPTSPAPEELSADDIAALKDYRAADIASLSAFHSSLISLAAGSVDRSRSGATATVAAASAIATIYAGLLGLVYSASGAELPVRALISPIFFAVAIALATAYLSYITAAGTVNGVQEEGAWALKAYSRAQFFVDYSKRIVLRRVWMLQAAVVALGVAVVGIALPFVSPGASTQEAQPAIPSVIWPSPDPTTDNPALDAILYEAQVDQAVAIATATAQAPKNDGWMGTANFFFATLVLGLLLVVAIPLVTRLITRERPVSNQGAGMSDQVATQPPRKS